LSILVSERQPQCLASTAVYGEVQAVGMVISVVLFLQTLCTSYLAGEMLAWS